ncbi:MAG: hypothetical protein P4L28_08290 [Paludibacteraceae bacterium]|nr:hypothetical protein [Paludibacteraceae bacterium]
MNFPNRSFARIRYLCTTMYTGTSKTIGSIVRVFKIGVTKHAGYSVWQRNYYEHIIRDYVDYLRIADYISDNPKNWKRDKFHDKK